MNYHQEAVKILPKVLDFSTKREFMDLIFHIAQNNPKALVKAYFRENHSPEMQAREAVRELCHNRTLDTFPLISAIKQWRKTTGGGLKESKEAVESVLREVYGFGSRYERDQYEQRQSPL